jgi:hypothetical protein
VYGEQVEVPLVLRLPGAAPQRRSEVVSTVDIAPTLLRLAGLAVPDPMEGRDLLAPPVGAPRPVLSIGAGSLPVLGWTEGRWRLVVDLSTRRRELFDREADPHENHDVSADHPVLTAWLYRGLMSAVCSATATGFETDVAAPTEADWLTRLEALGDLDLIESPDEGRSITESWCSRLRTRLRRL